MFLGLFFALRSPKYKLNIAINLAPLIQSQAKIATLLFAGDAMLDRGVRKQIEKNQDPLYPFLLIADKLRSADFAFVNLEGPITDRGEKTGSEYSFRFEPVGTINALKFAGIDAVSIANNHIFDYGQLGLTDTVAYLRASGIGYARNQESYEFALGKAKLELLAYTNLYPGQFDLEKIASQISILKMLKASDLIIISMHWGEEYQSISNEYQQNIAHQLIDAGADLIIGHHPHVVQEIEEYRGKYIAYSLGNFIFDQYFSEDTMKGLMLEVKVADKKISEVNEIPIQITETYQPYIISQ